MTQSSSEDGGTESDLAILFREWQEPLLRYIARRVPDRQVVPDLAQQVWTALVARWDLYGAHHNPVQLMYGIAGHKIADWYRQQEKAHQYPGDEQLETLAVRNALCEFSPSQASDIAFDLSAALERLTEQQRRVLVHRYVDGMKWEQIAAVMGISLSVAKRHLDAAIKKARRLEELTGYGIHHDSKEMHT